MGQTRHSTITFSENPGLRLPTHSAAKLTEKTKTTENPFSWFYISVP